MTKYAVIGENNKGNMIAWGIYDNMQDACNGKDVAEYVNITLANECLKKDIYAINGWMIKEYDF